MKVTIIECATNSKVGSKISEIKINKEKLPSITDGWRFNFSKHSKNKETETYILVTDKKPTIIEGCLIINTKRSYDVYMAYVEVAPHNRGTFKKFDRVAGCLIAFACRQSFIKGKEGYLTFDVMEENEINETKLMELYSKKYNALRLDKSTTMIILPQGSEKLIKEYLM